MMSPATMTQQNPLSTALTDAAFESLQQRFNKHFYEIFLDDLAEKTVVIIPSLTLPEEMTKTLTGVLHYEERMLCMLMLLRMPRTQVIYVTSIPIDNSIVDYYLHFLPGITGYHARQRLTLFSCYDASAKSLTEKILDRPRLIKRVKGQIKFPALAHISCFNVTDFEKRLALELDIPIFGCDPNLSYLGTKTGSRQIFRRLSIPLPEGFEALQNENDIAIALAQLKKNNPVLLRAVVKLNEGFTGGEGNAVFNYSDLNVADQDLAGEILEKLPTNLNIVAEHITYQDYMKNFCAIGGIAEEFVEGEIKESPSVQCRINPFGEPEIISTHNQLLGGESGQIYLGATFPANSQYHIEIALYGQMIADELQRLGVLGRFGVDFVSVKQPTGWKHYAIEINLRKVGTTHPFIMLNFLTGGEFNWQNGVYVLPNGQTRCYYASDNVVSERYKGLTPHDLIDIAMCDHILYDISKQTGVMFHMIGALSQYGKLGLVCIGRTVKEAHDFYFKTIQVLDRECAA